jgi:hypothetical protein
LARAFCYPIPSPFVIDGRRALWHRRHAFAVVSGVLTPFFDSTPRMLASAHPNLVAYSERMMRRFCPDFTAAS